MAGSGWWRPAGGGGKGWETAGPSGHLNGLPIPAAPPLVVLALPGFGDRYGRLLLWPCRKTSPQLRPPALWRRQCGLFLNCRGFRPCQDRRRMPRLAVPSAASVARAAECEECGPSMPGRKPTATVATATGGTRHGVSGHAREERGQLAMSPHRRHHQWTRPRVHRAARAEFSFSGELWACQHAPCSPPKGDPFPTPRWQQQPAPHSQQRAVPRYCRCACCQAHHSLNRLPSSASSASACLPSAAPQILPPPSRHEHVPRARQRARDRCDRSTASRPGADRAGPAQRPTLQRQALLQSPAAP